MKESDKQLTDALHEDENWKSRSKYRWRNKISHICYML